MISSPRKLVGLAALLLGGCAGVAGAQDFSLRVAEADWGDPAGGLGDWGNLGDMLDLLDPTLGGLLKGQVAYSLAGSVAYDSNVDLAESGGRDDMIFSLSPRVVYTSDPEGGAENVITGYYAPNYQTYLDRSELGRFNQSGGVSYANHGARGTISAFLNLSQASGADRLADGYAETTVVTGGVGISYELAARTSVWARLSGGTSDYSTGQQGSDRYGLQLGGRWAATERLRLGPALRLSRVESSGTGTRTATGLVMNVSYQATELVDLSASLGAERVENSRQSGSEVRATGDLRASYALSPVWSLRAAVRYATVPSPVSENYLVDDLTLRASLSRALTYGLVAGGLSYSIEEFQNAGPAGGSQSSDDFISGFLSYQRPIWNERASWFASLTYSRSEGGRSWERVLATVGVSVQF